MINNLRTMVGGHTVHYVVASYSIDHGGHFQYILYRKCVVSPLKSFNIR